MSVRSRGRYVPRTALLTSRKLRSPQDLNRRCPLARPIPTGPPHRSMFASTTRPVRHSIPLPLSIAARPHEAGLLRSWRADSLALVWLDPGITPCSLIPAFGLENPTRSVGQQSAAGYEFAPRSNHGEPMLLAILGNIGGNNAGQP